MGQIWPMGSSLLTPDLESKKGSGKGREKICWQREEIIQRQRIGHKSI